FVFALFALASAASAQNVSLAGRVVDTQGGVVVGATVQLDAPGGTARTAMSGSDGMFTFANMAPGAYVLRVRAAGFSEWSQPVTLTGAAVNVDVMLNIAAFGES